MTNPDIGPRCPACRMGLVTHVSEDPHCILYGEESRVIPEEAVERGARVLIEDGKWGVPWEDATEEDQAETKDRVRAILEAAIGPVIK